MSIRVFLFALVAALLLGLTLKSNVQIPSMLLAAAGAVGVLVMFLWGLARPEIPLYVLAAYLPFSEQLPGDFGGAMTALNLTNLLFFAVLIALFFERVSQGQPLFPFHSVHVVIALLAGWGCLSYLVTAFSPDAPADYASRQLQELKRWLDPFMAYYLFFLGVRRADVRRNVVGILMIVVVIVAVLALFDYEDLAEASLDKSRVGGVIGQPNLLGAFFTYYMFLFASYWLNNLRQPRAWLLLIPFALCFRGIMVTFSRGAYLAFAGGLLGLAFFKKRGLAVATAAALALVAFNPWLLPAGIQYRIDTTFERRSDLVGESGSGPREEDLDKSSSGRLIIWRTGLEMVKAHPVLGVGFGNFKDTLQAYLGLSADAHNAYVITAAELGVPGLALLLFNLALLFYVANRVHRRHPDLYVRATALGFLGGLSALVAANMFGDRLNSTHVASYFWILAAIVTRADVELKRTTAPRRRADAHPL